MKFHVNLQHRAFPLTLGNSTLYSTSLEQSLNIIPTIVTCSVHTNMQSILVLGYLSLSQKRSLSSFPFLFRDPLILAFWLIPCTQSLQCVQNLCKEVYFLHVAGEIITWRPQLGNVLYNEHTNQAKIPSNLHYVGGVHKKVHITSVPL